MLHFVSEIRPYFRFEKDLLLECAPLCSAVSGCGRRCRSLLLPAPILGLIPIQAVALSTP